PNGDSYAGDYQNGVKHGNGKAVWTNGNSYDGAWANGASRVPLSSSYTLYTC
ncbi:hypothetical protein T484DRAFT_1629646, partial [Baffinella frigidus]